MPDIKNNHWFGDENTNGHHWGYPRSVCESIFHNLTCSQHFLVLYIYFIFPWIIPRHHKYPEIFDILLQKSSKTAVMFQVPSFLNVSWAISSERSIWLQTMMHTTDWQCRLLLFFGTKSDIICLHCIFLFKEVFAGKHSYLRYENRLYMQTFRAQWGIRHV